MSLGILAFAVILGTGYLWFRAAMAVRLPENRIYYVAAWLTGIALAVAALAGSPGWLGGVAASLALLAGGFVIFTVAISRQSVANGAVGPGDTMPAFTAQDDTGARFDSTTLAGKPVLLKFFRGHW